MAGAYCKFCNQRCFVLREIPDGRMLHLATCHGGMAHDRAQVGVDHTTSVNPLAANLPEVKALETLWGLPKTV